jgi:NAD(P)H-flavin reductase
MVCIAGGVGITAVLPIIKAFSGNVKLYWGVRNSAIVDEMEAELKGIDVDVVVGRRIDLKDVLEGSPGRFAVVASGPPGLADDARAIVAGMAKTKDVKLYEEFFAW